MIRNSEDFCVPGTMYHGTIHTHVSSIEKSIDFNFSEPNLDFGKGFYVTSNPFQAWKRAEQKAKYNNIRRNRMLRKGEPNPPSIASPVLIEFEVQTALLPMFIGKEFHVEDEEWARFILGNRSEYELDVSLAPLHNRNKQFDYVYGPLADGNTLGAHIEEAAETGDIDRFLDNILGKYARFPQENQFSIHTEVAKDCLIRKGVIYNEPSRALRR